MIQPPAAPAALETDEHKYARQTRNAVVWIAWIVVLSAVAGLILGIVAVVNTNHALSVIDGQATCSNSPSSYLPSC